MKTKAILLAALLSAGLMFTSCQKAGEPSPKLIYNPDYPKADHEADTAVLKNPFAREIDKVHNDQ